MNMNMNMNRNIKIFKWSNKNDKKYFIIKIGFPENLSISNAFKHYKDYNENNYIVCYIYVDDEEIIKNEFNEKLYNEYHSDYLKYYEKNPNIKFIIFTNSKESVYWCKNFFKFFNSYYYYYIDNINNKN